ncbi:MAG: hypothetical protein WCK17_08890 [Verrucomicrobiota bacterium]
MAVAQMLAQRYPQFFKPWQTRVDELSDDAVCEIVERVPEERISKVGRRFILAFLAGSRKLLNNPI